MIVQHFTMVGIYPESHPVCASCGAEIKGVNGQVVMEHKDDCPEVLQGV